MCTTTINYVSSLHIIYFIGLYTSVASIAKRYIAAQYNAYDIIMQYNDTILLCYHNKQIVRYITVQSDRMR